MATKMSLPLPFTAIDTTYSEGFKLYLDSFIGSVETVVTGPLLTCVTLWAIVQGVLVMRGDIDARRGLTKLISVALVVGLVTSSSLYQEYVQNLFLVVVPSFVQSIGGTLGLPVDTIPTQLDVIYRLGNLSFQGIAMAIPPGDDLDAMAFDMAQFFFVFTLWAMFGIYDLVSILTTVLVALGPIFIIGFLFEATKDMTMRWVGQLVNYAILLLLVSVVESAVLAVIVAAMGTIFGLSLAGAAAAELSGKFGFGFAKSTAGSIIGLYDLDLFIMTGNALVVALPAIAAALGNGVAAQGVQMGAGIARNFALGPNRTKPHESAIQAATFMD